MSAHTLTQMFSQARRSPALSLSLSLSPSAALLTIHLEPELEALLYSYGDDEEEVLSDFMAAIEVQTYDDVRRTS